MFEVDNAVDGDTNSHRHQRGDVEVARVRNLFFFLNTFCTSEVHDAAPTSELRL